MITNQQYSFQVTILSILVNIFFTSVNMGTAQESIADSIDNKSFFAGYPLVFFTPETRLGFGAAAVYTHFPGKLKSKRPSQYQVGGAYTLNKQIFIFSFFNVFLEEDKHNIFGEIAYYDYFYQYFGIGNNTSFADEEIYAANFPRVQINYLRKWKKDLFFGAYYHFDFYNISNVADGGLLDNSDIIGKEGSIISRPGLLFRHDTRDNIFYPTKGQFLTIDIAGNTKTLGASSSYMGLSLDISRYFSYNRQIFAFNTWIARQFGDVPFQELLPLGGGKKARGIIKGRYRDTNLMVLQGEYRFPIWKRFLGAAFVSYGNVGSSLQDLFSEKWKLNYGAGLRFLLDKENGTNLRADVAFGSAEMNIYLTVNEAF